MTMKQVTCCFCNGKGFHETKGQCPVCNGKGTLNIPVSSTKCTKCKGKGVLGLQSDFERKCPSCKGTGWFI